jgi:hypothetical protein
MFGHCSRTSAGISTYEVNLIASIAGAVEMNQELKIKLASIVSKLTAVATKNKNISELDTAFALSS